MLLDDKEFQGASLITLLQNAEDFVRNNSKNPWSIRGMTREERSDYPYKAVREVLVNALIHRNYQILGSEIHVEVFDDRLEITSPGGMMNGRRVPGYGYPAHSVYAAQSGDLGCVLTARLYGAPWQRH